MHQIMESINLYITYAPLAAFIMLILAGFNLPFSEDLIIITSALLARTNNQILLNLYIALLAGVIISDHMAYWIGNRIGHGLRKKYLGKFLTPARLDTLHRYVKKYGIFSFIVCRFIPFGVRNTLFISAGIMRMRYALFTLFDTIAALISVTTLYFLIYHIGAAIERPFYIIGIILFILLLILITMGSLKLYRIWKHSRHSQKPFSDTTCSNDTHSKTSGTLL
jgi:membrane protein DedA with SNARE-associated domain